MAADKHNAELLINRVKDSGALPENKKIILDFYNEQLVSGVKYSSMTNYLKVLSKLVVFADKPFKKLDKTELVDFFMNVKPCSSSMPMGNGQLAIRDVREYSPQTLARMKTNVKIFWRWMCKGDKTIERDDNGVSMAVSWIKANYRKTPFKYPKDALNREEIDLLIKATTSTRTKAMIAVLFESGMRAGEFLGMRRSQMQFFDDYCEFICDGKTGKRAVVLVKSYPYLKKWLAEIDSRKDIPKEYADHVWLSTEYFPGGKAQPIQINGLRNVIKYAAAKTNITKRVWVHGLRHSSTTDFVKQGYNEAEIRLKYGWTANSDMPSNYTHYKQDELKDKILSKSGKESGTLKYDGNTLKSRECPFCSTENIVDAEYCYKCGKPITMEKVKATENEGNALNFMQTVISELKNLENKGLDIQQFNRFMEEYVKTEKKETTKR